MRKLLLMAFGLCFVLPFLPGCPAPDTELVVSVASLDFGANGTLGQFQVWNADSRADALSFQVSTDDAWIDLIVPEEGTSDGPSDRVTVTVTAAREGLAPGVYYGTLNITSNGGSYPVTVSITVVKE